MRGLTRDRLGILRVSWTDVDGHFCGRGDWKNLMTYDFVGWSCGVCSWETWFFLEFGFSGV